MDSIWISLKIYIVNASLNIILYGTLTWLKVLDEPWWKVWKDFPSLMRHLTSNSFSMMSQKLTTSEYMHTLPKISLFTTFHPCFILFTFQYMILWSSKSCKISRNLACGNLRLTLRHVLKSFLYANRWRQCIIIRFCGPFNCLDIVILMQKFYVE